MPANNEDEDDDYDGDKEAHESHRYILFLDKRGKPLVQVNKTWNIILQRRYEVKATFSF